MKKIYIFALFLIHFQIVQAQVVAPNFILTDIDGVSHELYEYLDDGKVVILDFYAVWCAPCQENAAGVEEVWESYGPGGSDQLMILGIEADDNSTDQEVADYAVEFNSNNPQINNTGDVPDLYGLEFYPTYIVVCPDRSMLPYSGTPNTIKDILIAGVEFCAPYLDLEVDARIFDYNSGSTLCTEETTPNFTLMNMGQQNLTSVDIKVSLDGNLESTTSWSGDLSLFEFENVSLPSVNLNGQTTAELSIVLENPNGITDPNPENDSNTIEIEAGGTTYETVAVRFELAFDNFPQETSWEFLNSIGEVVISGDGYIGFPDFSPPIDTVLLLPTGDCYVFNIYDDVGDGICCAYADPGEGFWKISDNDTNELIAEGGTFTYEQSALFGLASTISTDELLQNALHIYPNPTSGKILIESDDADYSWELLGVDGKLYAAGQSGGNKLIEVDVKKLGIKGACIVKLTTKDQTFYQKLIVY